MIVAAAALAVLPKSDAVFERQQLGSNLRLRKEHAVAVPSFITEPSSDEMKEIIKSKDEEIDSLNLKAMLHQMKDELAMSDAGLIKLIPMACCSHVFHLLW